MPLRLPTIRFGRQRKDRLTVSEEDVNLRSSPSGIPHTNYLSPYRKPILVPSFSVMVYTYVLPAARLCVEMLKIHS